MVETTTERVREHAGAGSDPWQLRWGAIIGGAFVALGVWALLYVFGLAIGLVGTNDQSGQFNFPTLFIGIWAVIAPFPTTSQPGPGSTRLSAA